MKRFGSRAVFATLAVAVVASLAAGVAGASTRGAKADVKLTFWQTMNDQETPTLAGLVKKYEAANPGVTVELVTVPFDQRDQKFTAAAQAGQAPDVMRAEIADVASWASQGFLADITSMVSAADKADYLPAAFAYDQFNGKTWGLPQVTDAPALMYNKRLLKAAGITAAPATMADLQAACDKLGAGKGIFLRGDSYWTLGWIWAYGGDLLNYPGKRILVSNAGSVAGLDAYAKLTNGRCAMPNKDYSNDYGNAMTAFKAGQVAMIVNGPWSTADVLSGAEFKDPANFGIAPLPKGPGGKQGAPVGGHSYVISRNSKNTAAAYKFIQWLAAAPQQAVFAAKNNLLPTRVSAYAVPTVKQNKIISAFLGVMKVATTRPVTPAGGQIFVDFTPAVQKLLSGKATASAAANEVANAWAKKLFKGFKIVK